MISYSSDDIKDIKLLDNQENFFKQFINKENNIYDTGEVCYKDNISVLFFTV